MGAKPRQINNVVAVVPQKQPKRFSVAHCFVAIPELRCIPPGDPGGAPCDTYLELYLLQSALKPLLPTVPHQVMVPELLLQIDMQALSDHGKVEAPTIIGKDGRYAVQSTVDIQIRDTAPHQLDCSAIGAKDADHRDGAVEGGFDIKVGVHVVGVFPATGCSTGAPSRP